MTEGDWERRDKARRNVERYTGLGAYDSPYLTGFKFMMISCLVIAVYEGVAFSQWEAMPSTISATILVLLLSFGAGVWHQKDLLTAHKLKIEDEISRLSQIGETQ